MIRKISTKDKFTCKVVSATGKINEECSFPTFAEAKEFKKNKLNEENVDRVEIYTSETNAIPVEDTEVKAVCCICKGDLGEYGNDPYPICEEGECCEACNEKFVIPARILKASKPYKTDLFIKCKECGLPVVLGEDENECSCGACYNRFGQQFADKEEWDEEDKYGTDGPQNPVEDSFEEITKCIKKPTRPLKHKKLKISTETAQKLAQSTTTFDARAYIGEYIEHFYERYRGVNVYKSETEPVFTAQFLEKKLTAKTPKEIEDLLDKEIGDYIKAYANDFEIKEIKEIKKDLTEEDK